MSDQISFYPPFSDAHRPEVEAALTTPVTMSYKEWIPRWISYISSADDVIRVLSTATGVTTPLVISNWLYLLANHPNKTLTLFFYNRHILWFPNWLQSPKSLESAKGNLECSLDHPEVVDQYLTEKLAQN